MGWEAEEGECDEASWGKLDRATKGREGRSHSVEKRVGTEPGRPEMLSGGLWAQGEGEPGIRAIRNGGRKDPTPDPRAYKWQHWDSPPVCLWLDREHGNFAGHFPPKECLSFVSVFHHSFAPPPGFIPSSFPQPSCCCPRPRPLPLPSA